MSNDAIGEIAASVQHCEAGIHSAVVQNRSVTAYQKAEPFGDFTVSIAVSVGEHPAELAQGGERENHARCLFKLLLSTDGLSFVVLDQGAKEQIGVRGDPHRPRMPASAPASAMASFNSSIESAF